MAKEWISTKRELPEIGNTVIASIKDGNNFYSEVLILDDDGSWSYNNGNKLEDGKNVVGWMDVPPTFLG